MRTSSVVVILITVVIVLSYISQSVEVLSPYTGAWVSIRSAQFDNQNFALPGLQGHVEITIDSSGTAHIQATNDHDLFYAQGFYAAYNRLDQMELQAILASGNLSRYIGKAGVSSDRTVMMLGLPWNAYNLEKNISENYPAFYSLLQDFSDGINSYIHSKYYVTPLVFNLAKVEPFDWSPFYSLVWQEYMAWTLTTGGSEPLLNSLLYSSVGFNETVLLSPYYPYFTNNVTMVPGDGTVNGYSLADQGVSPQYFWSQNWMAPWATGINQSLLTELAPLVRSALGNISDPYLSAFGSQFIGSNSWVVTGNDSSNGKPMLANDPHLPLYVPSLWIPMQLEDPNYNVTGWELAGEPGILIGHTPSTAWGLTTSEGNSANDYLEVLNGNQYLYEGTWHQMKEVNYTVGGSQFTVFYTNNGPLIARDQRYGVSLNWAASYGDSYDLLAELGLDGSTTYQQMLDALRYWGAPPQNFALVSDQHAGYITAGTYPVINETLPDGAKVQVVGSRLLLNGTVSTWEPSDRVPFQYLPQATDPARGYLFAPNQPTVGENYPYPFVGGYWDSGGRALSILSYLNSHSPMSLQDMMSLQSNLTDYWAVQLTPMFTKALAGQSMTATSQAALQYLESWDHTAQTDSVGMTVYWYLLSEVENMTYGKFFSSPSLSGVPTPAISTTLYLALYLPGSSFFNGSFGSVVSSAFQSAVSLLQQRLGGNVSGWTWGKVHRLLVSSFSGVGALSIGPTPIWGDSYTVSVGAIPEGLSVPEPFVYVGSSLRFIASPAAQQFFGVFPGGPSGNVLNLYYSNQLDFWLSHQYYNMINQTVAVRWSLN